MRVRSFLSRKRIIVFFLFLFFLLLLLEAGSRIYWFSLGGVSLLRQADIIYCFYPELKAVKEKAIGKDDGYFDILFLGGSVLNSKMSPVEQLLFDRLSAETGRRVRIHNVAKPAHTSLDSFYKYRFLKDKNFDLVVFYHGINDLRANNCPADFFKTDYSHFLWYDTINSLQRHKETPYFSFLFTAEYLIKVLAVKLHLNEYLPIEAPREDWLSYGRDIKTSCPFRENLKNILDIAGVKNEPFLLMTFVYYVPPGYRMPKGYEGGVLEYSRRTNRAPIALWGEAAHVILGLETHNKIIREIAANHKGRIFIDQDMIFPKERRFFMDICHFTSDGAKVFVGNIVPAIKRLMQ
ncbi:MAG: hypothetical protein WC510_01880 [Candidatus Omnitrophota bacterium]